MRKNSVKNTRINGEVLKELSNIIRSEIKDPRINPMTSVVYARTVNLRNTPEIKFILDQSIEYGINMSKLIDEVTQKDSDSHNK